MTLSYDRRRSRVCCRVGRAHCRAGVRRRRSRQLCRDCRRQESSAVLAVAGDRDRQKE